MQNLSAAGAERSDKMITNKKPGTLLETVPFMVSEDYRDRILAEFYQLEIRINKLKRALECANNWAFGDDLSFMKIQLGDMIHYRDTLKERILHLGIDHNYIHFYD